MKTDVPMGGVRAAVKRAALKACVTAWRAAAASTDLVSHLGGVAKNILVISGYLNFPIEAIKAE